MKGYHNFSLHETPTSLCFTPPIHTILRPNVPAAKNSAHLLLRHIRAHRRHTPTCLLVYTSPAISCAGLAQFDSVFPRSHLVYLLLLMMSLPSSSSCRRRRYSMMVRRGQRAWAALRVIQADQAIAERSASAFLSFLPRGNTRTLTHPFLRL